MTPNPPNDVLNLNQSNLKLIMATQGLPNDLGDEKQARLSLLWPSADIPRFRTGNDQDELVLRLQKAGPEMVSELLHFMLSKGWLVPTLEINHFLKKGFSPEGEEPDQNNYDIEKFKNPFDDYLNSDNCFLVSVNKAIEEHLCDENFKPNHLSKKIFLCKMQVYRKLKKLADLSTSNYIRKYRLSRSLSFLKRTNMSVSEVSYRVGFRSLEYFSRSFKKEFGFSPSCFRKIYN